MRIVLAGLNDGFGIKGGWRWIGSRLFLWVSFNLFISSPGWIAGYFILHKDRQRRKGGE